MGASDLKVQPDIAVAAIGAGPCQHLARVYPVAAVDGQRFIVSVKAHIALPMIEHDPAADPRSQSQKPPDRGCMARTGLPGFGSYDSPFRIRLPPP